MQELPSVFKTDFGKFQVNNNYQSKPYQKVNLEQQPDTFESSSKTENNKTAKKQTAKYIAIAAAAVAVTAGAIFALKKGKSVKLENIKFDKGIASLKDGTKFTGKIKDKLKNGDKIVMEYADGVLQKSTRSGAKNIEKVYEVAQNGDKIVKQTIDGVQKAPVNITKITNEVKSQQSKLQAILKDVNLSSQELQQKTGEINFKSAKQKEYIKNTIADKKDAELKAKAEAERIAKEAEEKAKAEVERIAKEKAAKEAEEKARAEAERIAKEKAAKEAEAKAKAEAERIAKIPKEINVIDVGKAPVGKKGYLRSYSMVDINRKYNLQFGEESADFIKLMTDSRDASLDEVTKLAKYGEDKPYDLPLRFMINTNERELKTGSSLITDEIPELFKGIEKEKIGEAIDNLRSGLDPQKINKFTIDGKEFTATKLGGGCIGNVYKISDNAGNSVAVKYFKDCRLTGLQGNYAEIPIMRQASKDGVIDIPKFYMAHPTSKLVEVEDFDTKILGNWQMVEYIDDKTPLKSGNVGFWDWLEQHGLRFGDYNKGTMVGKYVSDVGGVTASKYDPHFLSNGQSDMELILTGYSKNQSVEDILKFVKK